MSSMEDRLRLILQKWLENILKYDIIIFEIVELTVKMSSVLWRRIQYEKGI